MKEWLERIEASIDTDYGAACVLIACAFVVVVFSAEAVIRSVRAASALPALLWSLPAIAAGAFVLLVVRGSE